MAATFPRSIEEVPLDTIRAHPRNLRRDVGDVTDLAESMRTFGVLEPIVLAPGLDEEGGVVLIAGHRRKAGAQKAGLTTIPAEVRHDLDTEAKQLLAMLVENGRRRDLSPIEEAHGYQQVLDLGDFTAAKIGKAIGVPTARVKGRISLTTLPDEVQDKIHAAQITLGDAEVLAEFAEDRDALSRLLRDVGSHSFRYTVENERRRRERAATVAEARQAAEKAGIRVIPCPQGFSWRSTEQPIEKFRDPQAEPGAGEPVLFTPEAHAAVCPHHAVIVDAPYSSGPVYVCTDPTEHAALDAPSAEEDPEEEAVWEAEREARHQRQEALIVAGRVRRSFAEELAQPGGMKAAVPLLRLVARDVLTAALYDMDEDDTRALARIAGVPVPDEVEDWSMVADLVTQAVETKQLHDLIGLLFALRVLDYEGIADGEYAWKREDFRRYIGLLSESGYQPTDVERDLLTEGAEDTDPDTEAAPEADEGDGVA